jgi:glutaredoxin
LDAKNRRVSRHGSRIGGSSAWRQATEFSRIPLRTEWWRHFQWRIAAVIQVVLYSREGCHLCHTAEALLEEMRLTYSFQLSLVDIDKDAELAGLYNECVPVISVNGRVRFRGIVNRVLLERLLQTESRASE